MPAKMSLFARLLCYHRWTCRIFRIISFLNSEQIWIDRRCMAWTKNSNQSLDRYRAFNQTFNRCIQLNILIYFHAEHQEIPIADAGDHNNVHLRWWVSASSRIGRELLGLPTVHALSKILVQNCVGKRTKFLFRDSKIPSILIYCFVIHLLRYCLSHTISAWNSDCTSTANIEIIVESAISCSKRMRHNYATATIWYSFVSCTSFRRSITKSNYSTTPAQGGTQVHDPESWKFIYRKYCQMTITKIRGHPRCSKVYSTD